MTQPSDMNRHSAFSLLAKLAEAPFDLTKTGALTPRRIHDFVCSAAGFDLLYATQRIDEQVLEGLQDLADQSGLIDQFRRMKRGDVLNRIEGFESEQRQVLHTATRDLFSESPANPAATAQAAQELASLKGFLHGIDTGRIAGAGNLRFTDLIHIGIGGSDLGPRALYLALAAYRLPGRNVHFISNVDPDDAAAVLRAVNLETSLVNVVSKSGTTLETLTNEEIVRQAFINKGLKPERHFIAVTGEKSQMDTPERYLHAFHMFDYIGGRYSATSMVGAVMLSFALGLDNFMEILRGANDMDLAAETRDIRRNPPLLLALIGIWNRNFLGHETLAILPYSQALVRFAAHLQQCDMESNGKSITRQGKSVPYPTGPIIWGEPGTNGQHAFYQLLHQGTTIVPAEFIGFRKCQYEDDIIIHNTTSQEKLVANLLAQTLALAAGRSSKNPNKTFPGNRPSTLLIANRLTPHALGTLLALYEAKVVFQGFAWNINSFDQEGVQLGKVLANRLLAQIATSRLQEPEKTAAADASENALLRAAKIIP